VSMVMFRCHNKNAFQKVMATWLSKPTMPIP
jgi:hypothetical protein